MDIGTSRWILLGGCRQMDTCRWIQADGYNWMDIMYVDGWQVHWQLFSLASGATQ